jgi:dephospho-CoA kinase
MSPFVIGLTGGVASGKSEAASILASLGAYVVDADQIARDVVEYPEVKKQLQEAWPDVFENGKLNRARLRKIIFSSREEREKLNSILHPPILNEILRTIKECPKEVCVVVAPLLIESGLHQMVDEVWVMSVPREIQIKRLMNRDKIGKEEAEAMIQSQMPLDEKLAHAHHVIDNSGSSERLKTLLEEAWKKIEHTRH